MSMTVSASQLMMQQMNGMKQQATLSQVNHASTSNAIVNEGKQASPITNTENSVNFSDLLGSAIKQVNSVQQASGKLKNDFEMGKDGVNLVEVMVAGEKASVAFSALLQTRNKLLRAYTQILNTRV